MRPSELIIGAAALLPAALKVGRDVKNRVTESAEHLDQTDPERQPG